MDVYRDEIVTPVFSQVETKTANLNNVRDYFEELMVMAEEHGFPGVGCLIANSMTELAAFDTQVAAKVTAHNHRLQLGYQTALRNSATTTVDASEITELAQFLVTSGQGLWSLSRCVTDAKPLRQQVYTMLTLVERSLC